MARAEAVGIGTPLRDVPEVDVCVLQTEAHNHGRARKRSAPMVAGLGLPHAHINSRPRTHGVEQGAQRAARGAERSNGETFTEGNVVSQNLNFSFPKI